MPEPRLTTLAEARQQARTRGLIGGLLLALALIFLGLFAVKHLYYSTPAFPLLPDWGAGLRRFINPLLHNWAVLALLWRAIPPWQPVPAVPTTPIWDYVYTLWGALVVIGIGGLFLDSARRRRAQIMAFYQEREREAWRPEARGPRDATPHPRGLTAVIQQGIWHQYAAPRESWYQRPWGIVLLGLVVAVLGGIGVLIAEYWFFQGGK